MQKEDSVDHETHFHKSVQELRDFSSQLYHTAEYCEATFLGAEDKRIIMEITKQYISRAVIEAVEHLGSVSANLESSLSKSSSIHPETVESLKMRIVECQQRSHKLALQRFYLPPHFSTHHCRYILPSSTDPTMNDESRDWKDEFQTEEPLFVHTHNCNPSLVVSSTPVLPVRGDGLSILPKSEETAFQFKVLKRSAINRKGAHSRDMAWLMRRGKRILA